MYAVIKTGGKQYRVSEGDEFTVEKLVAEAGEKIQFNEVLMLGGDEVKLGTPLVDGAAVSAEVVEQTRGPKVLSFKKRRWPAWGAMPPNPLHPYSTGRWVMAMPVSRAAVITRSDISLAVS